MPKTAAVAVSKAGAKVQRAQKKVSEAEKALAKSIKARDQAEYEYFKLLKEALPAHVQRAATQPREVIDQPTAG